MLQHFVWYNFSWFAVFMVDKFHEQRIKVKSSVKQRYIFIEIYKILKLSMMLHRLNSILKHRLSDLKLFNLIMVLVHKSRFYICYN